MKLLSMFLVIIYTSSCMAVPSKANAKLDESDCADIESNSQLESCIYKKMKNSKARLSEEIVNFEKRTKKNYNADLKLGEELIEIVLSAQDAWTVYRDRQCKIDAFQIEKQAPAYATTINNCITKMNNKRLEEIKKLLR